MKLRLATILTVVLSGATTASAEPSAGADDLAKLQPVPPVSVPAENEKPVGVPAYLDARCATALCFHRFAATGSGEAWLGIEPMVELPVGKSFGLGSSSLASYVNNHDIKVDLAAGLRIWLFEDLISLSVYLSFPLSSSGIRVEGSEFTYPGSSIRRPYPGVGIGLLYDIVWVSFDHDELRNGDTTTSNAYNPEYPANARISSCTTVTVALQPVTAARALFGAVSREVR
jgi:hypothetical protein